LAREFKGRRFPQVALQVIWSHCDLAKRPSKMVILQLPNKDPTVLARYYQARPNVHLAVGKKIVVGPWDAQDLMLEHFY